MQIITEKSLKNFEFWAGAVAHRDCFTDEQMDIIEDSLADYYVNGIDETTLNDLFWFDEDFLAMIVGYESFEELMEIADNA